MKVILRPLRKDPWSGITKYKNCFDYLAPYFTRSGRIYTGLIDADAKRLGERLGHDLSSGSSFWKDFVVRVGSKDLYLDTEDPMDELRYLFLKSHKRVKNSLMEKKATADYVIINKDEEAKKVNVLNKIKRKAIKSFDELSPTEIKKALRLYGVNADNMSSEVAEQRLFDLVEGSPERFLERWVENAARETEVLLAKAISKNVIRKNQTTYKYGSEIIGRTKEEAVDFLDKPDNQDIKRTIILEVDAKDYIDNREVKKDIKSKVETLLETEDEVSEDKPKKKASTDKNKK